MSTNESDSRDLAQFGYKQELHRSLGDFSSFAAGFSYMSILTGMFQTSYLGFLWGGRAFLWAWPVVFFGQFMVALQFAELAAHYPLAGSVYQWSKNVASKSWGWNTGWMYLWAQITTVPAVALGWQVILPQVSTRFQFVKCTVSTATGSSCPDQNFPFYYDPAFAKNAFILGLIMIFLTTVINMAGVKLMSQINNIGVATELVGAAGLIVIYLVHVHNGPSVLFKTDGTGAGHAWGWFGAVLVAAIMPLYVCYGFDTAGALAEETADPRRTAPKSVIRAIASAGIMGFLLIIFAVMAVSDKGLANLGTNGLAGVTTDVLGDTWGKVFLVDVALAIFVCCLAIHAATVRVLFAMSRDNNLPGARMLATVSGSRRVPVVPAIFTGVVSLLILSFNLINPYAFTIIVSLGIIFMYLAYLGVTIPLLGKRNAGWPGNLPDRGEKLFSLGGFGKVTNVIAIIYGAAMVVNLAWPREAFYGTLWYQKYGPITGILAVLVSGVVLYYGYQRPRMGVLEEHRAGVVSAD